MNLPRPKRVLAGIAVAASALILAACGNIADPEGWATPSFDDGTLYYFPDKDQLTAITVEDDSFTRIAWAFPDDNIADEKDIDLEAVYGAPLELDGNLYFAGWEGHIYSINSETGRLNWTTQGRTSLDGSIVAGLATDGERIFAATTEGRLYTFLASDGSPAPTWPEDALEFDKGIYASPVVANGTVFVATMTGQVHALNSKNGEPAWPEPFESGTGAIAELSLIDDDLLFVPSLGRKVYYLDTQTGTETIPATETTDWVWTTPAVEGDMIYFGDFAGVVHAVDITTGAEVWTQETGDKVKGSPAIVGDTLVVPNLKPSVTFIDKETGQQQGNQIPVNGGTLRANAVARDGVAYLLSTNGTLFRADPSNFSVVQVPVPGAPD